MEAQSLQYLNEVSAKLDNTPGKPGDLTATLRHIARTAQEAFHADACVIIAFNPITGKYTGSQAFVGGKPVENPVAFEKPRPNGVTRQILSDGIVLIKDIAKNPYYQNRFTLQEGIQSFAGLALRTRHRQRPLGVIYLDFKERKEFSDIDRESYRIYAVQASFLLQETWLARHYEEIARIGQAINYNLSTIDELFKILQKYVETILDETHTLLLSVYNPQTNMQDVYLSEHRNIHIYKDPLRGAAEYIINKQQPYFIEQLSKVADKLPFKIINLTGMQEKESFIFIPVMFRGSPLAVLSIQHDAPKAYGQEDIFVLRLLASYIALALHNIRLYSSLTQLNETGQVLTQLLESEDTLQAIADQIRHVTQADVVVLYPYEPQPNRFVNPPYVSGDLLDLSISPISPQRPDDIASLMLRREKPIFAKESATVYSDLQGDIHIRRGYFQEREHIRSTAALQLRVGKDIVGVLFVNFRQPQRFDATQKLLIEGLAHYAAIGIKNAQAFGTLSQRRIQELTTLQYIDRELNRTLELDSVLNTLLHLANEQIQADEAAIMLYNSHAAVLGAPAAIGPSAQERKKVLISMQEARGITRWVLEHKQSARVGNVHSDPEWQSRYIATAVDTVSELDVPLVDKGEVIGVFNFESARENAFRQEDEDFLLTLAGQAVLAIKNAQAYEREKRLAEEAQALNAISKEITSQLDLNRVFTLILEKALELTRCTLGSLHLYDPEKKDLLMIVHQGVAENKRGLRMSLDQGIVGYVARNRELLNVKDVRESPWNTIYIEFHEETRSELLIPMLAGSELRGVLNVESPLPGHFSESDERLLRGLADLAVVALQNAERYQQAERDRQRFELLYKAAQRLSEITDLTQIDQAYETVIQIAATQSQSQSIIYRYDEVNAELILACATPYEHVHVNEKIALGEGLNGYVAQKRETLVIDDWDHLPAGITPAKQTDPTMHSYIVLPILFKDQYYGNLDLRHQEIGHFRGADILFFESLAQQLANTIHRLETAKARLESEQRVKSAEEMSSIGQSAYEVTHRLGNDLGLVQTYVEQIQEEMQNLSINSLFIDRKLESILQAVHKVLSFSRDLKEELARLGDHDEKAGEMVVVAPEELLEEVARMAISSPGIELHLDIDRDIAPVLVFPDPVADILQNLVTNAIQAMPAGGKLTLRARNAEHFVALEVSDTGVGIPQNMLSRIFDLFFSTKGSSGFGLWSARRNALRNHGDLKADSKPGEGTTFTLLLPRANGNKL